MPASPNISSSPRNFQQDAAYLNALPSALIAIDRALHITYLNHAAEMLLSASLSQFRGKPLTALFPLDSDDKKLIARIFRDAEEISLHEVMLPLAHGETSVTLHLTPVLTSGQSEEVLLTIEKTEGFQKLSASEWKKEISRAAGIIGAMIAHEVKNPLSGIRGAAQMLKEDVADEHKQLAELIYLESGRIRDLLAQVDMFADETSVQLQPVNIHEVLQYVISVARAGFASHVTFKELYDPSLPLVSAQRERLVQLFLNLIKNAAEALENNAEACITITTAYRSGYRLRDAATQKSLPVIVSIGDNGAGIAPHLHAKLFEPFFTSKGEGRGMGLAITAKIATDLGAVVELDSDYKNGAKFNVMLGC